MQMDEPSAISFKNVTKRYKLGGGPREQLLDAFGLAWLTRRTTPAAEFLALDDVSFTLGRGRRMGLIGRNGAGKTTLLKLISGNFRPSEGGVEVNGSIQALMTMGQGFHPDYTGRENIRASLYYNGLSRSEAEEAFDDVVEFCELGSFIEQPFKTYSSGMQARLMFATATAIRPDVLVVDEVLGAGDAYFLAKSKQRVEQIISRGCTLLLVSHSMGQVLELCDEVIWLEGGRVAAMGEAFHVVKAYEEAVYGAMPGSGDPSATRRQVSRGGNLVEAPKALKAHEATYTSDVNRIFAEPPSAAARTLQLQVPRFLPHAIPGETPAVRDEDGRTFRNTAPGGLSRWAGSGELSVVGFTASGPNGPTERLTSLQPAKFTLFLEAAVGGMFACTYGVAIHDLQGRAITRLYSPPDRFQADAGDGRRVELLLNPNQLGPGTYTVGISILGETMVEDADAALRHDLLSRSFSIIIELPDSLRPASAGFFHSCEWEFHNAILPAKAETGSEPDDQIAAE